MMVRIAATLALCLMAAWPACASDSLDRTLALVHGKAYRAAAVDWPRVEASARAIEAREGTDAAIRYVLKALGDPHSSYQVPMAGGSGVPKLPRATSGVDIVEVLPAIEGIPALRINGWSGDDPDAAARRVRASLAAALAKKSCGIVLDFSRNAGGNMWPMLVGLAPLLSQGRLGGFRSADGVETIVTWRGAGILLGRERQLPQVRAAEAPPAGAFRIGLIIGPGSASSGEITPLMFLGQANVRIFGAPTAGFSTANQVFPLPNGGLLVLTTAVTLDRAGRANPHGLVPEVSSADPEHDAARWVMAGCDRGGR